MIKGTIHDNCRRQCCRHFHLRTQLEIQMDGSTEEQQMALSTESSTQNIAKKEMLSKKIARRKKVFIFGVDRVANVKTQKILHKNSSQSVFFHENL